MSYIAVKNDSSQPDYIAISHVAHLLAGNAFPNESDKKVIAILRNGYGYNIDTYLVFDFKEKSALEAEILSVKMALNNNHSDFFSSRINDCIYHRREYDLHQRLDLLQDMLKVVVETEGVSEE